jgi:hypothetical protein
MLGNFITNLVGIYNRRYLELKKNLECGASLSWDQR